MSQLTEGVNTTHIADGSALLVNSNGTIIRKYPLGKNLAAEIVKQLVPNGI